SQFDYFLASVLLGEFASSCFRVFSFDLVHLSIGWNFPSSAFCKAGFVDSVCITSNQDLLACKVSIEKSGVILVGPFHGVPDFLDILFNDLFGFGVFLDCRIYFLYCILYIGDSVFHLLYSVGYACICIS
ncbi:hypothetical protein STEG23_027448, partial [Scotinomys teguina]